MYRFILALVFALTTFSSHALAASRDTKAEALIRQVAITTRQTRTLSAVLTLHEQVGGGKMGVWKGKVYLEKPNRAHIESSLQMAPSFGTINSDGKRVWERAGPDVYRTKPADAQGRNIQYYFALPVAYFFNPATILTTIYSVDKASPLRYLGKKTLNGTVYNVVEQAVLQPHPYVVRLYIGADKRLYRVETDMPASSVSPRQYSEADFSQVKLNAPIPAARFTFTLPPDATMYVPPSSHLLAVGSQAPNFLLSTLDGRPLTLQEALHGKKAIYLDFWFCECQACRHEFPELQKLYTSLRARGLAVYAVDAFDNASKVRQSKANWDLLRPTTFPIMLTGPGDPHGVLRKYDVDGYPAGYLINKRGKVIFTSVGFDSKTGLGRLRVALTKAGIMR